MQFKLQTTFSIIDSILSVDRVLTSDGDANLVKFGAKTYYLGGGWWRFSTFNDKAVATIKTAITSLDRSGIPCNKCGKLSLLTSCFECGEKEGMDYWQ